MPLRPRGRRLLRGIGRTAAIAGTAGVVAGRVNHYQQKKWAREEREEYERTYGAPPPAAMAPPPPPAGAMGDGEPDVIDELKELSSLHEAGVLNDDEFAAAKAKILD